MTRIHQYVINRARERFNAIKDLYQDEIPVTEIEELVHRAMNDEVITDQEGADILEFWESGELLQKENEL